MCDHMLNTILMVDDDAAIRTGFALGLEDCGYRLLQANNGRQGLEVFELEKPDLVLLDLRMPEMDGLELLQHLKQRSPDTPLIVISGTGMIEDAIEAIRYGAWDFLCKPVSDMSVLTHTIDKAWERAQLIRENRRYQGRLEDLVAERTECLVKINESLSSEIAERIEAEGNLKKIHQELVETSHHAGKAEVATNVLHNVGNILNSINVTATLIRNIAFESEVSNLNKVADMIEGHTQDLGSFLTEDSQGKHIPIYLIKVARRFFSEQEQLLDKLHSLMEDVCHIKDVIKMQQSYAKVSGVEMCMTIDQVIEQALHINQASLDRYDINVVRQFADLGDICLDKQKIIQILVNLISNAKHALIDSDQPNKQMTIRTDSSGEDRLRVEIIDNGVGISPDNLGQVFRHGFTTKEYGHGFGLHSCALTAKDMGGTMAASSKGMGQGACFILELPLTPTAVVV
jgi:two-component system, NtrC family, sensor kinase